MNIAFIPVRGGSKSIPLKNIKLLAGKPLVYWTAFAASTAKSIDKVVIATDSEEIRNVVKGLKLTKIELFNRNSENATDTASTESVMLEYIEATELNMNENFVLIQATSPLLTAEMIDDMIVKFQSSGKDSALSCVRTKRFFWNENGSPINYDFSNRPRRQDFNGWLMENGAVYINRVENILHDKCRLSGSVFAYEMPEETAIEIDEPGDFLIIEKLMTKRSVPVTIPTEKTFCFDIDGVLGVVADANGLDGDYGKNIPNIEIIELCNRLHKAGNKIILYTARGSGTGKDWREATENQMLTWGVCYNELHFGKPPADYYVDDKAMTLDMLRQL